MLNGMFEFRGYEEKTSSKGNRYINLFCEDCDNDKAVRFYVGSDLIDNLSPAIPKLEKGTILNIKMNYHAAYGGRYQADFVGYEV